MRSMPSMMNCASTVIAMRLSRRLITSLVFISLVPGPVSSLNSHLGLGSIKPIYSSFLIWVMRSFAQATISVFSGSSQSKSSGPVSTGSPARLRSIPIASISSRFFLKYHGLCALLKMLMPSGFPPADFVRSSRYLSLSMRTGAELLTPKSELRSSCQKPCVSPLSSISHLYKVVCALKANLRHAYRPSL